MVIVAREMRPEMERKRRNKIISIIHYWLRVSKVSGTIVKVEIIN